MRLFTYLQACASTLFRPTRISDELDEELRSHIQHRADDLERSGLLRAEAERRARVEFGGQQRFKQQSHEELGGHSFEVLQQDIRFALRTMRKSPGFTVVAVLTLALAIGANAVVFSILNGLILRPINVPQARNLYTLERGKDPSPMQSYPDFLDLRDRNRTFDGIAAYSISRAGINTGGKASTAWLYEASGNYFDTLGIQPYLGRFFHNADEHGPNSSPYIVLGYAYWQTHFQGSPDVVGRRVQLNSHPFTILGVAPQTFRGTELFFSPDLWVPLVNDSQTGGIQSLEGRGDRSLWLVGRLKSGVTPAQATSDLNAIGAYLSKNFSKDDEGTTFSLSRPGLIGDFLGRPVRAFLTGLMSLAALILLAACANLGSLSAARAADRSREIALRLALGSSRKRILRQLVTEAVLISLLGGVTGLLGAVMLLRWLSVWQPMPSFPASVPVSPDASVYLVALLLALISGILFGLVPIRQVLRANPYQIVKAGSSGAIGRKLTIRDVLLVLQIAVCAVLVTSSLVAVRGLIRSLHSDFGFRPENVLLVDTDLDMGGYSGDSVALMQKRMLDAVQSVPGVTSAGLSDLIQLGGQGFDDTTIFKDSTTDLRVSNAAETAYTQKISPDYLRAAGTVLLSGRTFTIHDDKAAPRVAMVNREFARVLFGSPENAIGAYFKTSDGTRIEIIGLVQDGKYRTLTEEPQAAAFLPILQWPTSSTWITIRSDRDPQHTTEAIDLALRNLDEGLPFKIRTWNAQMDNALFASRVATISLGVLGTLGAMLAITGIFGMASYSVSKRLRELGIRIALGAQRKEVLQTALGRALKLLAFGSITGLVLGLAATRVLSFIVYQATPRDPLVLSGVVVAMLLLGLVATCIPAYRALKADPLVLLREE